MNPIAFQGESGAYSETAVYSFFGRDVPTRPCIDLEDVFKFVEDGDGRFGVVPIENSIEGSINKTYDLLLASSLQVYGEIIKRISHCLIALPGVNIEAIDTVLSHPQALAQCRDFLRRSGFRPVSVYDTAGSVKMIREQNLRNSAALASRDAAELHNMRILAEGIEDTSNNYTRFFVLSTKDHPLTGQDKTSVVLSVEHHAGALWNALHPFALARINLTKIESRPTRIEPWEYYFYLDFEGHREEKSVSQALTNLESDVGLLKVLGSYPIWSSD